MALAKKGIFFTLTALVLVSILLFSSGLTQKYSKREKSFIIETRVSSMNSFILSIEEDIERGVYISGYRALLALEDRISNTGTYIDNTKIRFKEAFLNGTVYANTSTMMINNTFINWASKIKEQAVKTDILLNFTINNVKVYQSDPWTVSVDINVTLDVSDKKQTASWQREKIVTSKISILGFEDPMYTVETGSALFVNINRTPFENNYTSGSDVSNLQEHMENSYYTSFSSAPNFLMRFEGNFSADPNGIESIIDKDELGLHIPVFEPRSSIDYLYWGFPNVEGNGVQGMSSTFVMDDETNAELNQTHQEKYQVQGLLI